MRSINIKVIWLSALVFMITLNTLAIVLPINGMSTQMLSDLYPSPFTPAGFTFSIWSVIYSSLIILAVYQLLPKNSNNELLKKLDPILIANFVLNGLWILLWHYGMLWLSLLVMGLLLSTLIMVYKLKRNCDTQSNPIIHFSISIYLGWISIATIANISILQTHYGMDAALLSADMWTLIKISIATILAIIFLIKFNDLVYSAVVIWAAFGISQNHDSDTVIYALSIMAMGVVSVFWLMGLLRFALESFSKMRNG
ncbi:tryptophan-rich sensory protein [Marinicellulosiphila megalodicopiae]|uniref:tryptophan-rich sensory protein n=1 Tax=Marinicellulosiphila megalodicopiae TaxID=2724896 RepID=UPI003BB009AC